MDAVLGYIECPWSINAIVEDIKLFLDDYPNVSLYWISRLVNMVVYESVH